MCNSFSESPQEVNVLPKHFKSLTRSDSDGLSTDSHSFCPWGADVESEVLSFLCEFVQKFLKLLVVGF